jgi:hypothetical protein
MYLESNIYSETAVGIAAASGLITVSFECFSTGIPLAQLCTHWRASLVGLRAWPRRLGQGSASGARLRGIAKPAATVVRGRSICIPVVCNPVRMLGSSGLLEIVVASLVGLGFAEVRLQGITSLIPLGTYTVFVALV